MELVKPYAELWDLPNDALTVKCAQLCYASETPPKNINAWLEEKWKNGHKSIFRHATYYYAIPCINVNELLRGFFKNNPYIGYYENDEFVFVSINGQTYKELSYIHHLYKYSTTELGLLNLCNSEKDKQEVTKILRKTVFVQTQISTSRELNRTSPNNICEQSTRYCNFTQEKFNGEVKLCQPHWLNLLGNGVNRCFINYDGDNNILVYDENKKPYVVIRNTNNNTLIVYDNKYAPNVFDYLDASIYGANKYEMLINNNMAPQDARGVLPLDTNTRVAYTYRIEEWAHILDLRYYGKTGKPHPNAKISANQIREVLNTVLPYYADDITSLPYFPEEITFF